MKRSSDSTYVFYNDKIYNIFNIQPKVNFWVTVQAIDILVYSIVLEVAYNVLPVYLGNIIFFWGL